MKFSPSEELLYNFLPFVIYLILLFYLGFKGRKKKTDESEYLLGSRSLTLPAFVATLVATWYGGILGVGEFIYSYGISNWIVMGLPYYFFALLFAWALAPKIRKAHNFSIPDMLYRSYNRPVGLLGSVFIFIMISPAPYILMLAILLKIFLNISFFWSLIIGTLFSVVYVYNGGFRSVVKTDILQFFLMFISFIILFLYLINSDISLFELPAHLDQKHLSFSGGLSWQSIIVWFSIASWTFIDPGFHQRCAAAETPQTARKAIIISVGFWFIFDMLTTISGLYAVALLPGISPLMSFPQLAQTVLPPFFQGIFFVGLAAIIMSTVDSYTFLSALTLGRDIMGHISSGKIRQEKNFAVKVGLIVSAVLAIILVLLIPSVIKLWYTLGSLFIPALLLPLLGTYFEKIRISNSMTLASMVGGFVISFTAFLWGEFHQLESYAQYLWGIEPFFPGLIFSVLVYIWGNWFYAE
jgi:SSS family solute:Na+ symporter